MNEFEKWLKTKTFYKKNTELAIAAAFAWKAALKWVLEELEKEESYEDFKQRIKNLKKAL